MLPMSHTQYVTIYAKNDPDNKRTVKGRIIGPWIVANTGRHTKWGAYDPKTGMRLFHACPTLTEAKALLVRIDKAGLELIPKDSWDGPQFGDTSAYTSDSVRAIGELVRPAVMQWTGRK